MLKLYIIALGLFFGGQPPSGGCVLKQRFIGADGHKEDPAAFRRLCVETNAVLTACCGSRPAAFRRLCVETRLAYAQNGGIVQPPSGGCVLKLQESAILQ